MARRCTRNAEMPGARKTRTGKQRAACRNSDPTQAVNHIGRIRSAALKTVVDDTVNSIGARNRWRA
jgi:hypothetical protein